MKRTMFWMTAICAFGALAATAPARPAKSTPVGCRVDLDRGLLAAGENQTAVVKVTLDAPLQAEPADRPPVNLAIVIDRSGSMSGDKMERAKEAAIEALRRLGSRDLFSLVIYDDRVETIVPSQSAGNVEWIEGRIREVTARGSTALFAGVSQGAAEIRKNLDGNYIHRIILLSDGLANVGPSSPADLGRLGASLLKERISVTTVGVGVDYAEDLMTQLSRNSDGNTYFVEASADLPRIFAAELGDVLNVVARSVVLKIEFPDGAKPLRIIGRDGRIRDDSVEIHLNQLYGGQQKYALVEVEVPATEPDSVREIAVAHCRYEDPLTRSKVESSGRAAARFSAKREEVAGSANPEVQADIIRNEMAIAKDRAIELSDEGKQEEAAWELKRVGSDLRQRGNTYSVAPSVLHEVDKLDADAEQLSGSGMSKRLRKSFRSESYQIRTQQENR